MKTQEAFERQLNQQLSSDSFPLIDITDRVMVRIRQHGNVRRQTAKKMVWMAGVAAVFLVLCGFGYTAVTWQLHRGDGSVSMEYSSYKPGDGPLDVDLTSWVKRLEPGEAALFYIRHEGKDRFVAQENPVEYTSLARLEAEAGLNLHFPSGLEGGYSYKKGNLAHNLDVEPSLMESLRTEAQQSGSDMAMRKMQKAAVKEVEGMFLFYNNAEGGEIVVFSSVGEIWRQIYGNLRQSQVEKVNLRGQEAFSVVDHTTGMKKVLWLDDSSGTPIYYHVSTQTPALVSSKALLKAAESLR